MAKKKKHEEKAGAPEWMVTFSDMMTLLLTFFVLLFSMSSVDAAKFDAMMQSITSAFSMGGGESFLEGSSPEAEGDTGSVPAGEVEEMLRYMQETQAMKELQEKFSEFLAENQLEDKVSVTLDERGLIIRFQDSILFTSGSADLLPQSDAVLQEVRAMLETITNHVRVEGHTDDIPINTLRFPSNWELSTSRATTVVRYMVDHGLESTRLSALGYAEFRPVVSNDTAEGRAKNRRVDIVVIRNSLTAQEPAPQGSAAQAPEDGGPETAD